MATLSKHFTPTVQDQGPDPWMSLGLDVRQSEAPSGRHARMESRLERGTVSADVDLTSMTISRYRIIEKLGEGGMGVVYKAEDTTLRRTVALKFLSASLLGDETARSRLLREAQAAAAVEHPNVCPVYEIDEVDGRLYIAMAYLKGQSLAAWIAEGPCDTREALRICHQVSEGLAAIHEGGVVHCDIKPANVFLTNEGRAVVLDFGLASLPGAQLQADDNCARGTIAYMSPEQALGERLDQRTDIWSTGVLLYELLSAQLPFQGKYEQVILYSLINESPEPLALRGTAPTVARLRALVLDRCLAKRPENRYASAQDLAADLRDAMRAAAEEEIVNGSTAQNQSAASARKPQVNGARRQPVRFGYASI